MDVASLAFEVKPCECGHTYGRHPGQDNPRGYGRCLDCPCRHRQDAVVRAEANRRAAIAADPSHVHGATHICGQLALPEPAGEAGDEQTGFLETIESLAERVNGLLAEVAALPGEEDGEEMPSIDTIRLWDRATIDQVDRWATARLAANGDHPESCSAQFATDGTTGERVCDCGLAAAVPPLPRVLGGEADPEPVAEESPAPDVWDDDPADDCPSPGCDLLAEHVGDHDVPRPGEGTVEADDDDDLLPGEPDAKS